MKVVNTRKIFDGAVRGASEATVEATTEEIEALVQALKTVEQFKVLARKALKTKEKDSDWTMYGFDIKKSDGLVAVRIDQGACG